MSQLISEKELYNYLKCSLRHAIGLREKRLIPHICLGRMVRYDLPAVEKALEKLTVKEA